MRQRIIMLLISILLIGVIQLAADTIIDSVYATPELDGCIMYRQSLQIFMVDNYTYGMGTGDLGISMIEPDPNSRFRAYVSFDLPQLPEGYELDSVYVRLYQYYSVGNDIENVFPVWDVPGGDTMFCIMDHIDYGNELDASDWTKGDSGDTGTLHTNIGIISDSGEDGYRYCDITDYVLDDYYNGREKTQYRLRHPIETDWDSLGDIVDFLTSFEDPEHDPLIVIYFKSNNSIEEVCPSANSISIYPNPFINSATVSFHTHQREVNHIGVYNLKGQLVRELKIENLKFKINEVEWDGKDEAGHDMSNGIYLIRVESKDVNVIRKVMKIK